MIDPETRKIIYRLQQTGMPLSQISSQFKISRTTVRQIIKQQGVMPRQVRKDKVIIDPDLLRDLYLRCDGWVQRIHEILKEEKATAVSYSTLTRLLRELELNEPRKVRCDRVPDEPGLEMQHDTTVYQVKLAGVRTRLTASLMYMRYSKLRYVVFYRQFNRFNMKCFFHEALMFWGYSAKQCVIDNTNLARLRGTGKGAIIVPEMKTFAERYSFEFRCHELLHANRKAGEERSFWTVETNFLPGRSFQTLEDMNSQAFQWATVRQNYKPASRTGLIPAKSFEHERHYLQQVPEYISPPYLSHERQTDAYGYAAFDGNYYWIPGTKREDVKVLQFAKRVKIYQHGSCVAEYPLPLHDVKNKRFSPAGQPRSRFQPKPPKKNSLQEEQRLRAMGEDVEAYVDYAIQTAGVRRHQFLRKLFALSRKITTSVFVAALIRARQYRIVDFATLEKIAWYCMSQEQHELPTAEIDEDFRDRPECQEGWITDEPDLSVYDDLTPDDDLVIDNLPNDDSSDQQHESEDNDEDE